MKSEGKGGNSTVKAGADIEQLSLDIIPTSSKTCFVSTGKELNSLQLSQTLHEKAITLRIG